MARWLWISGGIVPTSCGYLTRQAGSALSVIMRTLHVQLRAISRQGGTIQGAWKADGCTRRNPRAKKSGTNIQRDGRERKMDGAEFRKDFAPTGRRSR